MIRVKSGQYAFYINGKSIYIKDCKGLNGTNLIMTKDHLELTPFQYAELIDDIYRRRITNTSTLIERVYSSYKLVPTSRKLPK